MSFLAKSAAIIALVDVARVQGGPAPAPQPAITPAAILPRATSQTLGWYSDGITGGETIYAPWIYDPETTTYTSSGNYFRRCAVSSTCTMYTGCSSGYMVGASSASTYCGIGAGTALSYCSNHVLLPTLGAETETGGLSWYWCDNAPLTGHTFYATEPAQPTFITESSSSSDTSSTSTTASDESTSSATSSPTPSLTTPVNNNGSSTPVGAIVGGVVGAVAVLAAIAFAIFWMMRRDKKNKNKEPAVAYQSAPLIGAHTSYQPNTGYPPQVEYFAPSAYQDNEQKPQGVVQQGYYPQSYPLGPYSPHPVQQYTGSPPPQELGAPVQFPPQELPAQPQAPK